MAGRNLGRYARSERVVVATGYCNAPHLPDWLGRATVLRLLTVPDLSGYGLPAPVDGISKFLRSQTIPILDHGFVLAGLLREVAREPTEVARSIVRHERVSG